MRMKMKMEVNLIKKHTLTKIRIKFKVVKAK